MARFETAMEIVNGAASEVGLTAVADVYGSTDPAFIQLRNILTACGRELVGLNEWNKLMKEHSITTGVADSGEYTLPTDFGYIIDQTGWTPTGAGMGLPLGGPLSPQTWTYLVATNLASSTIYVSFRMAQGKFWVLPQPPPSGINITFEYISRNWVLDVGGVTEKDKPTANGDTLYFEPILIQKFLKLRYLEAKGFDTTSAVAQFTASFMQWTGKDLAAPVLNAAGICTFPYLDQRNIPYTNYGQ